MRRIVVITGLGTVNSLGNSVPEFWNGIQKGKSGITCISKFDCSDLPVKIAGEVKNFNPGLCIEKKLFQRMDLFSQYALASSVEAVKDAAFADGTLEPFRTGIVLGVGGFGWNSTEECYDKIYSKGCTRIPVLTVPKVLPNLGAGNIAMALGIHGLCYSVSTACAAGNDAIGQAAKWIADGYADIMLAGGAEACITKMGVGGFAALQALTSSHNDSPETASSPFDRDRDGFVIGEGAGMVVLEDYEHAIKRGARIYCQVSGYGFSCDAYHITSPYPEGIYAANAMKQALQDADISPKDIQYVNAHGTSTVLNDRIETQVIKKVFGDYAYKLKISSIKSMIGHCIGAAGGIQAVSSALSIYHQWIPPTVNYKNPDPLCDLDYVPDIGINVKIDGIMSDSFGFGGHNSFLVFRRIKSDHA